MMTFKRDCVIETMIEVPFKAMCPIPEPYRPYHGIVRLRYYGNHVLDFNEVAGEVLSYCGTPSQEGGIGWAAKSVEDIAEHVVQLVKEAISKLDSNVIVTCEVEIPQQEGHLHVVVSVDGADSL